MQIKKCDESKITREFSRFAHSYETYNVIQLEVAKELIENLHYKRHKYIVDIGCGSGAVYKNITQKAICFERFVALDASKEMLSLHPNSNNIHKYHADFNVLKTYDKLGIDVDKTLILSSSALQWSKDLKFTFKQLSKRGSKAYFAIFTAGTFRTLHQTAKIESPIYTTQELKLNIEKYYRANFLLKMYRLEFKTVKDMFSYIKKSGVSGGKKQLTYKQTKELMKNYPLKYLEFEVLFVEGTPLA